jgi:hypothetical protein
MIVRDDIKAKFQELGDIFGHGFLNAASGAREKDGGTGFGLESTLEDGDFCSEVV